MSTHPDRTQDTTRIVGAYNRMAHTARVRLALNRLGAPLRQILGVRVRFRARVMGRALRLVSADELTNDELYYSVQDINPLAQNLLVDLERVFTEICTPQCEVECSKPCAQKGMCGAAVSALDALTTADAKSFDLVTAAYQQAKLRLGISPLITTHTTL